MIKLKKFVFKEKLDKLPRKSGVYIFKNERKILYIGKAVNIRERLKTHFNQLGYEESFSISEVKKIGYILTNSEIEALILEANLIKKYQPKYNVLWRDDKNYFFVAVTKENFPRVFLTHQRRVGTPKKHRKYQDSLIDSPSTMKKDRIEFIGPFIDGAALKQTLKVLRKIFPYRSCFRFPNRPCLWYQLKMCQAPCLVKNLCLKNKKDSIYKELSFFKKPSLFLLPTSRENYKKNLKTM